MVNNHWRNKMSIRFGTDLVVDILCRVPPLLVLDRLYCVQLSSIHETLIYFPVLVILSIAMSVLFVLPIQQLQEAYSYLLSLFVLVMSHLWSTKIIVPGSTSFTLNFEYNASGRVHRLADDPRLLLASAVVLISLAQLFIALRTSRPSYQRSENNNRMDLLLQLLLYLSFTLPLSHAVLQPVLPNTVPLTLALSTFLPLLLLIFDWLQAFSVWVSDLPRVFKSEMSLYQAVGLADYFSNQWQRLHVPFVLRTSFVFRLIWLTAIYVQGSVWEYYVRTSSVDLSNSWQVDWDLIQHLVAGGCQTWVALLGFSAWLALLTFWLGCLVAAVLGMDRDDDRSVGTVSAVLFFILALQTGLTWMEEGKRLVRLFRNLCLLSTAILHFFHSMLHPLLMNISASHTSSRTQHARPLAVCAVLVIFSVWLMIALWQTQEMSTWLLAVTAFCVEIVMKVAVSLTVYALFMWDACKETFWEGLDDYVYYVQAFGNTVEFLFGIFLFCNGAWIMLFESGGTIRALMMCIHAYFNIWCQAKEGWRVFTNRRLAVVRMSALDTATQKELEAHGDVCAICYQELKSACITRCRHFFHAVCLRKWLYVQDKCPICHTLICEENSSAQAGTDDSDIDEDRQAAENLHLENNDPNSPEEYIEPHHILQADVDPVQRHRNPRR